MKNIPLWLRTQARCPKLKPGQLWFVFSRLAGKYSYSQLVIVLGVNGICVTVLEAYSKKRKLSAKDFLVPEEGFITVLSLENLYASTSARVLSQDIFCKKEGGYCVGYVYKKILSQLKQNLK